MLLGSIVKTITNNNELVTILNRLEHGVSYSVLQELNTENAYQMQEQQLSVDIIIHVETENREFAENVADNIDRNEETLSWILMYFLVSLNDLCLHIFSCAT